MQSSPASVERLGMVRCHRMRWVPMRCIDAVASEVYRYRYQGLMVGLLVSEMVVWSVSSDVGKFFFGLGKICWALEGRIGGGICEAL